MDFFENFFTLLVYFSPTMFVISVLFVWRNKDVDITIYSHMMFLTFICAPIFCIACIYLENILPYELSYFKSMDSIYLLHNLILVIILLLYAFLCSLYLKRILKKKYNTNSILARFVFVTLLGSFFYIPYFLGAIFLVANK